MHFFALCSNSTLQL